MKNGVKTLLCIGICFFVITGCSQKNSADKISDINSKEKKVESQESKYDQIAAKAKEDGKKHNIDLDNIEEELFMNIAPSYIGIEDYEDMEEKTDLGVQGVVVSNDPSCNRDKSNDKSWGMNKIVFYVNKVLHGDKALEGKEIVILQSAGFVTDSASGEVIFEYFEDEEFVQTGEEFIVYLTEGEEKADNNEESYYNMYVSDCTKFIFNKEIGQYQFAGLFMSQEEDEYLAEKYQSIDHEVNKRWAELNNKESNVKQTDKEAYKKIVSRAKKEGEKTRIDFTAIPDDEIDEACIFSEQVDSLHQLEQETDLGIQGVVVKGYPHYSAEDKSEGGIGLNRLVVYVNKVLHGDRSLEGEEIIIFQFGGFKLYDYEEPRVFFAKHEALELLQTGDEFIAYLKLNSDTLKEQKVDYNCYEIWADEGSRFDYNEQSGEYEQARTKYYKRDNVNDQYEEIKKGEKINKAVNSKLKELLN